MSAVIQTGGKQYHVSIGDILEIEQLTGEVGNEVKFDQVLLLADGEKVSVGTPIISGATVAAEIVEHGRQDKIEIIKFRRRKHHMKHQGHRQYFTKVKITDIKGQ